jgi:hypothetical protein
MISAFDLGGPSSMGNIWTSIASGLRNVGGSIRVGAQTSAYAIGKGAKATGEAWRALDPQTQAWLVETGQQSLASAIAARQQGTTNAALAQQAAQQQALMMAAQRAPAPAPARTSGAMPGWLLPVGILGAFGVVALMLMQPKPPPRAPAPRY